LRTVFITRHGKRVGLVGRSESGLPLALDAPRKDIQRQRDFRFSSFGDQQIGTVKKPVDELPHAALAGPVKHVATSSSNAECFSDMREP